MSSNNEEIRQYLLGGLGPEARESIELRIIEDEEFATGAMAAEDDLIESYIDGELTPDERERFRSEYLTSEARAGRVKELAALRGVARADMRVIGDLDKDARPGFFDLLIRSRAALAFSAAAVLLLAAFGLWTFLSDRPTVLEAEYAELNRGNLTDLSTLGSYSSVPLVAGTFRTETASGSRIVIAQLSPTILFRLPLTFEPPAGAIYRADVMRGGDDVFTLNEVRPVEDGSGHEVRLLLPRDIFQRGHYQITLNSSGTQAAPVVFSFTVE